MVLGAVVVDVEHAPGLEVGVPGLPCLLMGP
jgi:hypothetical protein